MCFQIFSHTPLCSHTKKTSINIRQPLSALLFVLLVFSRIPLAQALDTSQALDQQDISQYREKVNRLQHSIVSQETKLAEDRIQERKILAELEQLDLKIESQQSKLEELDVQTIKQQILIDEELEELASVELKKKKVQQHLQKRISAYYTTGKIGILNVTFSTKTLPELLSFHEAFNTLIQYDKEIILNYQKTIENQRRLKNALELEKSVLEEFRVQTELERVALIETKAQKHNLLTHVRTQEKLRQQAISELRVATGKLVDSIVSIKNRNSILEKGFITNKGSLPPPVDGTLITLFNEQKKDKLGILKKSAGIELSAPDGTKVSAVSEGEVIYSGYLRGYGNTVIIHHGYQYYTVTSRIEKINASKGQKVNSGDQIGVVGDTATLFDEGLYFEIRHGKQSLDPVEWLNPNKLSSLHESPQ